MDPHDFDKLWNYGDPAGTEEKFRAILPDAVNNPDPEYYPQLLTQIARATGLQRKFDAAHEILDTVEAVLTDETPVTRVRYLLERGRVFNSSRKKDLAKPLFVEAWDLAREAGEDFLAVDAAHMVAIAETGAAGLAWNMKAIEYAENSKQPRAYGWLGSLYNNTGWDYHEMGDFEKALDLFQRALLFRESQGHPEAIRIAKWSIGRCLRSLGRLDEALEIQNGVLADSQAAGEPDGYAQEELGELLLAMGKGEEAAPHFAAAYKALSQDEWLLDNEPKRIARLLKLGQVNH